MGFNSPCTTNHGCLNYTLETEVCINCKSRPKLQEMPQVFRDSSFQPRTILVPSGTRFKLLEESGMRMSADIPLEFHCASVLRTSPRATFSSIEQRMVEEFLVWIPIWAARFRVRSPPRRTALLKNKRPLYWEQDYQTEYNIRM